MLLSINVLVLLLLQLALSSPVPLTTPSRGCPTCKPNPMQTQASEVLNATTPGIGGQCGVYTLSCAVGLRCAPPPGEPRPLRALLEGRGVCSNASSIGPTANAHLAGKSFLLCVCMQKGFTDKHVSFLVWACHSSALLASPALSLKGGVEKFLQLTCLTNKCLMLTSMSLFNLRCSTDRGSKWGKTFSCNKPNIPLVKQTELMICVSSDRVHVGDCWQPLSKVSTPIYLTPNMTSTCPTVTSEVTSGRNRQDLPPNRWITEPHSSGLCSSN